jgi:DNA ligase (NAD+)
MSEAGRWRIARIRCRIEDRRLSLSVHYEEDRLFAGVTRGDGSRGEDVSSNVRTIRSVPLQLNKKAAAIAREIEVRV